MPEWLIKSESYEPAGDKDTFVDKSILSLLRLIARIKARGGGRNLFYVDAFFKVLFTLLLIVLLSLSRNFTFLFLILTYLLLLLSLMPAKDIIAILKVDAVVTLFTVVVLLPTVFYGNNYSIVMIPAKVFASVTAVNILSHSTPFHQIIGAFKRFHLPDLFIFVLDSAVRYIVMLGEFALESLRALKLRSVGRNKKKYTSVSGVAGTMFLKSREMAEELYYAMECRGFTGEYRTVSKFRIKAADLIYIAINGAILYAYLYLS